MSCDVVIDNPNVSRRHAEIRVGANGWELADTGSSQGTFVHDQRVATIPIENRVEAVLGRVGSGVTISIETERQAPAGAGPIDNDLTEPVRPGGELRAEVLDGATVVTTDELVIECAGRSYRFNPGQDRVIDCWVSSNRSA